MLVNDVLLRYEFLSQIKLKNESDELSKDLKVKIISIKIEYGKTKKQFDEDNQEIIKSLLTEDFTTLRDKVERSEEEQTKFEEMNKKINAEYAQCVGNLLSKDIEVSELKFSADDMNEIILVNVDTEATIQNRPISSGDFLESLSLLF